MLFRKSFKPWYIRRCPIAEYDTIPKQLIRIYPQDLIRLALGREDVEIEVEEVLDPELPKVETRLADSVIRVWIDGRDIA